jgi:hypothetical protein
MGYCHRTCAQRLRTNNIIVLTEEDIVGKKKRVVKKRWNGLDEFLTSFKD